MSDNGELDIPSDDDDEITEDSDIYGDEEDEELEDELQEEGEDGVVDDEDEEGGGVGLSVPEMMMGYDDLPDASTLQPKSDFFQIMQKATSGEDRKSDPYLTKYEYTRVRGVRLQQLASGCPPFVLLPKHVNSIEEIFEMEFQQKRLPYLIRRPMPGGKFEYWKLKDLLYLPTLTETKAEINIPR